MTAAEWASWQAAATDEGLLGQYLRSEAGETRHRPQETQGARSQAMIFQQHGLTRPADFSKGYARDALFLKTSAPHVIYVNRGDENACRFTPARPGEKLASADELFERHAGQQ
jgi:hypothetical protein